MALSMLWIAGLAYGRGILYCVDFWGQLCRHVTFRVCSHAPIRNVQ